MADDELDDRLRRHYADRLGNARAAAPPFEATLAAGAGLRRRGRGGAVGAWLVPAGAALALAWLLWPQGARYDVPPEPQALLAELTSSTRWQAPSDRWLGDPARPAYLGLPRIGPGGRILDGSPQF